jgi:hypothetical protein
VVQVTDVRRRLGEGVEVGPLEADVDDVGDAQRALKTMRALAPVLDVRPEELAALVAGGEWATTGTSSYASAPDMMVSSPSLSDSPSYNRDKVLLSLERRLRDVPPPERIALLNEMIAAAACQRSLALSQRVGHAASHT